MADERTPEEQRAWQRGFDLAVPSPNNAARLDEFMRSIVGKDAEFTTRGVDPHSKNALYEELETLDDEKLQSAMCAGFDAGIKAKSEVANEP